MAIGAVLGPLLPASSALSTERTPRQMGDILLRATRCGTVILLASGLPLMVAGYWVLRLWVGATYAEHGVQFLRILLLANIIRQLCAPYATIVVATAKQRFALASAITEAAINLAASVWFARHYGAIGVAAGTLLGSFAGVAINFGVTMHYTPNIAVSRMTLLLKGMLRPAIMAIPSALLLPRWWFAGAPAISPLVWFLWGGSTLLIAWLVSFNGEDRGLLIRIASGRTRLS
jgi:O-antigen/teichoic acid export membrane protein